MTYYETSNREVRPSQSLQLTAGRCDDQLEFMKQIVDVAKLSPAIGS